MSKRKFSFNEQLQKKFPYIKKTNTTSDLHCEKCSSDFSIAHGGISDIIKHLGTKRHKSSDISASTSKTVTQYFKGVAPSKKDLEVAAAEGLWAYHTVKENQSFRSTDCSTKIVKTCFEPKFSCSRTKCEAIIVNVFAPYAETELKNQIEAAHSITLLTDASNHGNIKLFPVLIRFFQPYEGVQVKLLDFKSQPGETSDIIVKYMTDLVEEHDLKGKLVAFCGDNTNCNFGGSARKGVNNVFRKLNDYMGRDLIGIGCFAHIVHNAVQSATDCLPFDIEAVVVKIYSYFYIYTVRVEELKEFCDFVDIEYKQLLGYSKTRWLALMPSVERILKIFPGLKSYFLSQSKCPVMLKSFFENPHAEIWLNFVHSQAATFHQVITKIEGENISAVEVMGAISSLNELLKSKRDNVFMPYSVRGLVSKLEDEGLVDLSAVKKTVVEFYDNCVKYLDQWSGHSPELECMQWASLKQVPKWSEVQETVDFASDKQAFDHKYDTELFDEFSCVVKYIGEQVVEWNDSKLSTDQRWVEIFTHFKARDIAHQHMSELVQFMLCLPGTNASTERVFSQMNKIWTSEKTKLKIPSLKALLTTKINFKQTCLEFHNLLKSTPELLRKIISSEKYKN